MTELVRWGPRRLVSEFDRDLDWPTGFGPGWMRRFFGWPLAWTEPEVWAPPCDVFTRGEDLVVRVELPGIDPARDVEVTADDGVLCITGERRRGELAEDESLHRVESWVGTFERSVRLPAQADPEKITAAYQDGILEVVVPKAAHAGRKVPVTVKGAESKAKAA